MAVSGASNDEEMDALLSDADTRDDEDVWVEGVSDAVEQVDETGAGPDGAARQGSDCQ